MKKIRLIPAVNDAEIFGIASLAEEIWNEYFPSILSKPQIDYMLEKFQSYDALKQQITDGYEYYLISDAHYMMSGYTGYHIEDGAMFLSKLYLLNETRGQHLSSNTFNELVKICQEKGVKKIWLTCNKYNTHSLDVYKHWGFEIVRDEVTDIGNGYVMDDHVLEYIVPEV